MSTSWDDIKQFYSDKFGTNPELVDLMAIIDILVLSASGASNKSISLFLGISADDVSDTLQKFFQTHGWEEDMSFNPYMIYCDLGEKTLDRFIDKCSKLSNYKIETLTLLYKVCGICFNIEQRLEKEWQ